MSKICLYSQIKSLWNKQRSQLALWLLVLAVSAGLAGCAGSPSAFPLVPVTGASDTLVVHEYMLVEQSADNPDHVEFANRVPAAVHSGHSALGLPTGSVLDKPNQTLAPYNFHLEYNPTPPFSGFALYNGSTLLYRDIAQVWPVAEDADSVDFALPFETMTGERLVASTAGVRPWVDSSQTTELTPPVKYGSRVAYAGGGAPGLGLYSGEAIELENEDRPTFGYQTLNGEPFYFYVSNESIPGRIHMHYAGEDLSHSYDRVVYEQTGDMEIFNPGGNGRISWFYALRDGLWYYVEVGQFK